MSELSSDCLTRYVIFEFKNYCEAIGQGAVYSTEKYLFGRALRTLAFIICRSGSTRSADQARLGILRETGKIIVFIDMSDLERMLIAKDNNLDPTEILRTKLDAMFVTLPK